MRKLAGLYLSLGLALALVVVACGRTSIEQNGGKVCISGTNCAGQCVDLTSDPSNCGGCGNLCDVTVKCVNSKCSGCQAGFTNCNGNCTDINSDPSNCGACGNACPQGGVCSMGACTNSCPPPTTNCSGACVDTQS